MLLSAPTLLDRVARALPRSLAERLALTRRDLQMLLDGISGKTPPPVIRTRPVTRSTSPSLGARRARVREIVRETDDVVSVVLEDLAGAPFHYAPGQFFTLCATVNGESLRRAYSASRPPSSDGSLRITVKRVPDGAVSTWVTTLLRAGDTLDLLGPSGSFVVDDPSAAQHVVLLGGGSGVTPLYAIASSLLADEGPSRVSLIYGSRGRADVIFADALDALLSAHPERFSLHLALDQPYEGFEGLVGPLEESNVQRALDALPESSLPRVYFVCGPTPMREAARRALTARGVEPSAVREEVFASPRRVVSTSARDERVTLLILGDERDITVLAGETILDAAMRVGLELPYSCGMGGCGACQCKRIAGEVTMETPHCLSEAERADGAVLTCVGRPAGPGVVLEVP